MCGARRLRHGPAAEGLLHLTSHNSVFRSLWRSALSAMKSDSHTCSPEVTAMIDELSGSGESLDDISESVDELRVKLADMKRLMEERKSTTLGELSARKQRLRNADMIDGTFLSWIFGTALGVILSVTIYAFYNLFSAVFKKFQSKHTEL